MKIFITGASGFVGGAAAKALIADEHEVTAMARSDASADKIRATGAEPVSMSLETVSAEHLAGCDAVIHSAAYVGPWGSREQFWMTNVEGTTRLLTAAREAGVRRFIYISSEAAIMRGQHLNDADETYPYPDRTPYLYSETKAEAERRIIAADDADSDFRTISLRPRLVWGPGDQTVLRVLREAVENNRFMWMNGGKWLGSSTHIDNLTHAIKLALASDVGGEVYFINDGEELPVREFFTRYAATQGIELPNLSAPAGLVLGVAMIMDRVWRLLGIESQPPLVHYAVMIVSRNMTMRIDKIRRELGYEPVISIDEGMAAMPKLG